jgi:hypothetical protein
MKSKKFEKKLTLNKKTIVNLSEATMKNAQGGLITKESECCTINATYCDTCNTLCTCPQHYTCDGLFTCALYPTCAPAIKPDR